MQNLASLTSLAPFHSPLNTGSGVSCLGFWTTLNCFLILEPSFYSLPAFLSLPKGDSLDGIYPTHPIYNWYLSHPVPPIPLILYYFLHSTYNALTYYTHTYEV